MKHIETKVCRLASQLSKLVQHNKKEKLLSQLEQAHAITFLSSDEVVESKIEDDDPSETNVEMLENGKEEVVDKAKICTFLSHVVEVF